MTHEPDIQALLEGILEATSLNAPAAAVPQLAELARLTESWGARTNLTGHRTARSICEALIGDAVAALAQLERIMGAPLRGRVIDLGSGAGYPGLPFAILRPEADVHLVEAREKRHFFQRAAVRSLALENAHPTRARIEDHATAPGDVVVAQAVGPIETVVELMRPYLLPGAFAVVPGGPELESPESAEDLAPELVDYRSPVLGQARRLWVGRASQR